MTGEAPPWELVPQSSSWWEGDAQVDLTSHQLNTNGMRVDALQEGMAGRALIVKVKIGGTKKCSSPELFS